MQYQIISPPYPFTMPNCLYSVANSRKKRLRDTQLKTQLGLLKLIEHASLDCFIWALKQLFSCCDKTKLKAWSNDRVHACPHQVKYCGDEIRYSLGLFTFNNGVIQVPEELVDESHPLLYNPSDNHTLSRVYGKRRASRPNPVMKNRVMVQWTRLHSQ
ncbi:hypothetical protein GBA52_014903 [Prunus armeniaca]|nr:hypothetical protein GBA52_014903 [Prunus armeniaca]